MKFPEAVRASDGSNISSPPSGPASFHFRGSCACRTTIARTAATTAPAHPRPTFHFIRGPAKRCNIKPNREQRRDHMGPVRNRTQIWILNFKPFNSHQGHSREEQNQAHDKQRVPHPHSASIWTIIGILDVPDPKNNKWNQQKQAQDEMGQKHHLVKVVLVKISRGFLEYCDAQQVR